MATRTSSLGSLVKSASLALSTFQAAVALLVGIGAACLMQSALVLSGSEPRAPGAWLASALAGLLCAAAWRLEHPVSQERAARALDRSLRQQGGLFAAWEARNAGDSLRGSLARLLEARLLSRIELPAAIRETLPSIVLPVAAPLLGVALLALALEARETSRAAPRLDLAGVVRGFAQSSRALSAELQASVDPTDAEPAELEALALAERCTERARAVEEASRPPVVEEARSEAARRAEECARDLARLSELLGSQAGLRERVAEAQNALDSVRRAFERDAAVAGALPGPGGRSVTGGVEPGTMPAPVPDRTDRPPRPSEEPVRPERGAFAGTSWPVEYDGIVSEWVERARRLASEPQDRPPER